MGRDRARRLLQAARRATVTALAAVTLFMATIAAGRPLTLEDMLQRQSFGAVRLAPGGRWLLVEQRRGFAAASRFDFDRYNPLFRTTLMAADLSRAGPLRPVFTPDPAFGYQAGPISPDGARVVVYRLNGELWELGIATFATRQVRWLGVTPEAPEETRTLQWLSASRLVVIALPPGAIPFVLRAARPQAAEPALWAASAQGGVAVTPVGSGRFLGARPQAAAKRLLLIDVQSGAVQSLATGAFSDLELSASRRRLALAEAAEDIPLTAAHPVQGAYGIAVRRQRLRILDLQTLAIRTPCPRCDLLTSLLSWSPRGDQLLAYVRPDGAPWPSGGLVRIDAGTGQVTPVAPDIAAAISHRPERVYAGWWGADPMLFGRRPGTARDDWFLVSAAGPRRLTADLSHPSPQGLVVTPQALLAAADGAAWRIDRAGQARRLSGPAFASLARRADGVPDRTTYALQPGGRLDGLSGGGDPAAVRLDARGAVALAVAVRPSEQVLDIDDGGALLDETVGGGEETLVWRRPGAADRRFAPINASLADVALPPPIAIDHQGPDGQPLRSWLFLPVLAPGAPPPPLVVIPYPGATWRQPPTGIWNDVPMAPAAPLIGHGYAVLLPSLPAAPAGRGPSDRLAERVLDIVDAAARQPGVAGRFDGARLALWGHSFGGYATAAIIGQTDRFRAAVATAPSTDLISFYGQFLADRRVYPDEGVSTPWSAGWTESLQGDMRAAPWVDPGRYLDNSPLMRAGDIHTPLLLAYGSIDGSHPGQAEELFSALYRQDKDAVLLTYWGEPHVFGSPGNLRDLYARAFAFLDGELTTGPRPVVAAAQPQRREPGPASSAPSTPAPPRS